MTDWEMTPDQKRALNRHAPFMAYSRAVETAVRLGIVAPVDQGLEDFASCASPTFVNHYDCDGNNAGRTQHLVYAWDDEADCACNDRCPLCNVETEPTSSKAVTE